MPDEKGELSPQELQQAVDWFKARQTEDIICPVCKNKNWTIAKHVVAHVSISGNGAMLLGGEAYPQILVTSTECGYTFSMNAVVMGIYPARRPPDATDGGAKDG